MRRFNYICSFLLVVLLSLFIVSLGQNITVRTSGAYLYYFNDSRVVDSLYVDYTNSDMAKEIAGFMNSWAPDEFQLYENTGYDMQGIFDATDSANMLKVKRAADISFIVCLLSLIGSVAIYVYFIKSEFKLVLRKRIKAVWVVSLMFMVAEGFLFFTKGGLAWLSSLVGIAAPSEHSALAVVLGGDFIGMAAVMAIAYSVIAAAVVSYATYVLTKPPRLFY